MTDRYSDNQPKISKPLLLIIISAAVVIIAAVCVLVFVNPFKNDSDSATASTVQTTEEVQTTATLAYGETTALAEEQTSSQSSDVSETSEQGQTSEATQSAESIVVPTISGEEQGEPFSATLTPYLAKSSETSEEYALKTVLGSAYSGGGFTFYEDGTFTDSVTSSSVNSGAYIVEGDTIVATYSNDRNMLVSVTGWNGSVPTEIVIDYGGINVYFK